MTTGKMIRQRALLGAGGMLVMERPIVDVPEISTVFLSDIH